MGKKIVQTNYISAVLIRQHSGALYIVFFHLVFFISEAVSNSEEKQN